MAKSGSMSHVRAVRTPLSCSRVALAVLVAHVFHEGSAITTTTPFSAVISSSGDAQDMESPGQFSGTDDTSSKPTTIIVGVSDSGTRGMEDAVMHLGWQTCEQALTHNALDSTYTMNLKSAARSLLQKTGHNFSKQHEDVSDFPNAVHDETDDATRTAECIRSSGGDLTKPWGYKQPYHILLLPVLDSAFERKTKYLLVARDPRDSSSAHNQIQFRSFRHSVNDVKDRLDYWADVWKMVLDYYEDSDHARIIRIEDLVMPDPETNSNLYKVCNFMQLPQPYCSQDKVVTVLRKMHSFSGEYMGHHYEFTSSDRETLVNKVLAKTNQGLFESMDRLGYNVSEFGLTHPSSKIVL